MTRRPLWIDLRHIAAAKQAPFLEAAASVDAEQILQEEDVVNGQVLQGDVQVASWCILDDADSQEDAAARDGRIVVECRDWTIIPLENLIAARAARPDSLYAVAAPDQVEVFADTLEVGVHGIVLQPTQPADITAAHALLSRQQAAAQAPFTTAGLVQGTIDEIRAIGPGDRVCIDATRAFAPGEGILVGSTAHSFALIHAETVENEFVAQRPFRVNAGALHNYTITPDGRTKYLCELAAGDQVAATDKGGPTEPATLGRAKVERRPMLLIRWHGPDRVGHAVVQNAETIRFMTPKGPLSVTEMKPGDQIMIHQEDAARHFGMPIDERLVER